MAMKTTSIKELKEYARGQLVELPPFAEGQRFVVRMKRPSMMALVKAGQIPNALLETANTLFLDGKKLSPKKEELLPEMLAVFDIIVEAALVEPTYSQIREVGIELTDDQLMAIFNYTQSGVKALERFHAESAVDVSSGDEQKVLAVAK